MGVLTGDFVFVGDVGRPDLLERAARRRGHDGDQRARQLFRSLQRLATLPDYLQIWPGHGAGSACGKALGAVPQSTLGYERRFNWAFGVRDEDEFVRAVLAGQPDPPRYFAEMKRINRDGPRIRGDAARPPRLDARRARRGARGRRAGGGHAAPRGASPRARPRHDQHPGQPLVHHLGGWLLPVRPRLLSHRRRSPERPSSDLVRALAGIGLDRVAGWAGAEVIDAMAARRGDRCRRRRASTCGEIADGRSARAASRLIDVRSRAEWAAGHLPDAMNLPLGELDQRLGELPRGAPAGRSLPDRRARGHRRVAAQRARRERRAPVRRRVRRVERGGAAGRAGDPSRGPLSDPTARSRRLRHRPRAG